MATYFLWIVAVAVLFAAAALARPRRRGGRGRDRPWPLEPVVGILSEPELVLYRRLLEALPECLVLPQVQLARALRFKRGQRDHVVWNRICQLSIDFLIVRPDTSIIAAVSSMIPAISERIGRMPTRERAVRSSRQGFR